MEINLKGPSKKGNFSPNTWKTDENLSFFPRKEYLAVVLVASTPLIEAASAA